MRSNKLLPLVGFDSKFDEEPHPGTGKTIKGWIWDERVWPSEFEINNVEFVPSIWDPSTDGLDTADFQPGIGDNKDLQVLDVGLIYPSGEHVWSPVIHNGFYYDFDTEGFAFSDDSVTQIIPSGTTSGINVVNLEHTPFTGEPITAIKWQWNSIKGRYDYYIRFAHRAEFTGTKDSEGVRQSTVDSDGEIIFSNIDTTFNEFVVDSRTEPWIVYLNDNYIEEHGAPLPSGVDQMEFIGTSTGSAIQQYHLKYSPVVSGSTTVVSYTDPDGPYTTWTEVDEVTTSGQYTVDYDRGVVIFASGVNLHPAAGEDLSAHYYSSISLEYEPEWSRLAFEAREADVNPINKTKDDGFLTIRREELDPYSITLEAELPIISHSVPNYGPVYLGGSFANLVATVRDRVGQVLNRQLVTFEKKSGGGTFSGGQESITAITASTGKARTSFNTPLGIDDVGEITDQISINIGADETDIILDNSNLTGDFTEYYIYKVYTDDPILGIDDTDTYYQDYFTEEEISGPTTTTEWESEHRSLNNMSTPQEYDAALKNGRKQLLFTYDTEAINPIDFSTGAFVPVRPLSGTKDTTDQLTLTVSGILEVPRSAGNEDLAGYFIAGPTKSRFQASVVNEKTGATIVSNEIDLEIRTLPAQDGTVLIENLNQSEKDEIFGVITPPDDGTLPLGWRIRSANAGVSSAVDGLTYTSINAPTYILGHAITIYDDTGE